MLEEEHPVKAWEVTIKSWKSMRTIVLAKTRHQARWHEWKNCREAGYDIPYTDFVARRCSTFDRPTKTIPVTLGWEQGREKQGCLLPRE